MDDLRYFASIGLTEIAVASIRAATHAREKRIKQGVDWPVEEFADQLTRFLMGQRLLPVHVAAADLSQAIASRACAVHWRTGNSAR